MHTNSNVSDSSMSNNNNNNQSTLVLVTGASGYIGSQCVRLLLSEGYRVRGTVRSLGNKEKVGPVKSLDKDGLLKLVEADLMDGDCWERVVEGCDLVLHVASPFPIVADERCIETAINGTLNVLKACNRVQSVRKVVLTSSCAAVNDGQPQTKVFDETSWTNVKCETLDAYAKSKTLAERAAWSYVNGITEGNKFALTALNPTLVFGPMLINEQGASISLMCRFLNGAMPAVPALNMGCVDVRDVARAHVEAMRRPETDGERILVTSTPSFWFRDIARTLSKEFRGQGFAIPRFQAPYWVLWLYSFIDAEAGACLHRVGQTVRFDNTKARTLLQMSFRDPQESFIHMAYSVIERGLVSKPRNYAGVPEKYRKEIEAAQH